MSFFETLQELPEDSIFGIARKAAEDPRPNKVNLGIGTYKDATGKSFVFPCIRKAEEFLLERNLDKEYLPIDGDPLYIKATLPLIFGDTCPGLADKTLIGFQTPGGTGALRVGAAFLEQETSKMIFVSSPTWPNHPQIFTYAGLRVREYAYYDKVQRTLDFSGMCQAIEKMPPGSTILLHACCHNPTGIDPTLEQWKELSRLIKKRNIFPFFDCAYQGFGDGFEKDAQAIRYFYEQGHEMLVAYSFSKNSGLYGERVGLLAVASKSPETAKRIASHVKQIIRSMYSNPALHGERLLTTVLQSPELKADWLEDLANMRIRVLEMRRTLEAGLQAAAPAIDFSFLRLQKGLFSFSGLNDEHVQKLQKDYAIYMPFGRINVAGLNPGNMDYVVRSILAVLK